MTTVLARSLWARILTARLHYHSHDDALVVDLIGADTADVLRVGDQLLVELDTVDTDARPSRLALTGVRSHPNTSAVAAARLIVGDRIWGAAQSLAAGRGGDGPVEVQLDPAEGAALDALWAGLRTWLRSVAESVDSARDALCPRAVIGVEFVPGRIHAVLTGADGAISDQEIVPLDDNEPDTVVEAVGRAVEALTDREPAADGCPVGLQLGGPVETGTGVVQFYDKPRGPGLDEPWKDVELGRRLRERTGREVVVENDASAFALRELERGDDAVDGSVAVLLVRQGIGAKLVRNGTVDDIPMEIGVFALDADADLDEQPTTKRPSIEARSGVLAVARAVADATGTPVAGIEDAVAVADSDLRACREFWRAGAGLARGVAAVQAVVNPGQWVIYGPPGLLDASRPAGRAFRAGLGRAPDLLNHPGLRPICFATRPLEAGLGAEAAALVARSRALGRVDGVAV